MGRQPCCDKLGVKKGPWTAEEDKKLINFLLTNGQCCWRAVPKLAGLLRCGKSCRLRWTNYLRPDLKRGLLTESEEQLVIDLHARLGNSNHNLQVPETDGHVNSNDNSSSPTENCSGDESRSLDIKMDDDPLMSCLLGDDAPLVDASWKFPAAGDDYNDVGLSFWDYQDFGVQEFGFSCLDNMVMNTLEMANEH
ncbi:hypothetical protein HHK36_027946 [Tetracentron sinense]|uniref:Uncharacterized protein n=1 Tax=Tetracentron sinense TaxID=13715 RepID=A0A834YFP9_TETSI|nr:hypothetical protein HHK36_027946 [Tetracentron sinense]